MSPSTRQHVTPLWLSNERAVPLTPLGAAGMVNEAEIQALVQQHPLCLPIAEIDPVFVNPVPICTELATDAGFIDNLLVTASGLPVLVECKLWRNPEGRREVVGQILDYAKELSRWSSADLQREVSRRLKRPGNPLLDLVRAAYPELDEAAFNDALTTNLRRGRFLLLIVGDGIREGVEAIADYLQAHAGLHFSLGLVEMPIYAMPDGSRLVAPRVLARTLVLTRTVLELPQGMTVRDGADDATDKEIYPGQEELLETRERFWREFLTGLVLDDPEQPIPKPARTGYVRFYLPAPSGSVWITVYRNLLRGEVGVMLSCQRNGVGEAARQAVIDDWEAVRAAIGGTVHLAEEGGRQSVLDTLSPGPTDGTPARAEALAWLRQRVNAFVNALRPRVRSAAADYAAFQPGL